MLNNKIVIDKNKYERFFEVKGGHFLLANIYLNVYDYLEVLIVNEDRVMSVFLSKKNTKKSRAEGEKFLKDKNSVGKYYNSFDNFIYSFNRKFLSIINQKTLTKNDIRNFFQLIYSFFYYYKMTEFFYTDRIYEKPELKRRYYNNIKTIEDIKGRGRYLLNSIFLGSNCYIEKFLEKVKTEYGYKSNLYYFSPNEIIEGKIDEKKSKIREDNYVLINKNKKVYNLKEVYFLNHYHRSDHCLKGVAVCKGKIRGYVRVVEPNYDNYDELSKEINKMNKGEILVSESTSPDLFVALQKSSAIITNQGGLGSHAAILSRELNKPCIVGVENATQFIKTGYYIEVDADNGYIRIINKNKNL